MTRAAASALCVLVGFYWLSVGGASQAGGGGFRVLVGIFTAIWIAAAVTPFVASKIGLAALPVFPVIALGFAVFAAVGPWILNQWVHADSARYAWVISHVDPCSSMGGGPGMLWVFGTSWIAAAGAFLYAATFPLTGPRLVGGIGLGIALLALTAAAMFPDPTVFARILGCM